MRSMVEEAAAAAVPMDRTDAESPNDEAAAAPSTAFDDPPPPRCAQARKTKAGHDSAPSVLI